MSDDVRCLLEDVFPFGLVERDGTVAGCWLVRDVVRVKDVEGRTAVGRRHSTAQGVVRATDGRLVGANVHVRAPEAPGPAVSQGLEAAVAGVPTPVGSARLRGRSRDASPAGQAGLALQVMTAVAWPDAPDDVRDASRGGRMLSALSQLVGRDLDGPEARAAAKGHASRRATTLRRFLATLDQGALRHLSENGRAMAETLGEAWDGLDPTIVPGAPLAAAFDVHPMMHLTLAEEWLRAPARFAADVAAGASGAAVVRGCAATGKVGAHLLPHVEGAERAFARLSPADLCEAVALLSDDRRDARVDPPLTLLGLLGSLPGSWVPRDDAGWDALLASGPVLTAASWLLSEGTGWSRLVNSGGRWTAFRSRLSAACGGRDLHEAVGDVLHVARAYADQVLTPARAIAGGLHPHASARDGGFRSCDDARPSSQAYAILFSGRSMPRMLEASAAWHRAAPRIAATVAALADPDEDAPAPRWPPAFPDHAAGDLALVVLTDDASLVEEGGGRGRAGVADGLSHCVGGYGGSCRSGGCRIASVRRVRVDGSFERLSTVELGLDEGRPVVVEHRGRGNVEPPDEASSFVTRYLALFEEGTLRVDVDGLEPVQGSESIRSAAGYAWHVPGRWEAVRDAWAPFVPRHLRSLGEEALSRVADSVPFGEDEGGIPVWRPEPFRDVGTEARPAP